jgi:flagellar motility protein MotE (MotC chaperone)
MKKIMIGAQVLIAVLILVKVASVFGMLNKGDYFSEATSIATQALAQSKTPDAPSAKLQTTPVALAKPLPGPKDAMEDMLSHERDLAKALAAKKVELDNRENILRADEQRLIALRKDITGKMALLKAQEEKMAAQMDTTREEDMKRYKDMAKVYEATPPAKAGPMMERLDIKTAAGITMHMKKDKAGALWAFISPQKAVDITKEITRNGGYRAE